MSSKRAQKAKKRAKREARRQTRRTRSDTGGDQHRTNTQRPVSPIVTATEELAPYMAPDVDLSADEKIGYMAYDGHDFLRKNGECIVAASAAADAAYRGRGSTLWPIHPLRSEG